MSFLVGCGGSAPTTVSEAPAATSVPEQAAATPTPEPPPATPTSEPPTPTPEPPTDTPTPELPTATHTPEPPTATLTPVPPTETPTLAIVKPQSGSTFIGAMEVSKAGSSGTASSGTVKLVISDDGSSITTAEITLADLKCPSSSSGSTTLTVGDPAHPTPIDEGKIEITASGLGKQAITGQFTSPTEAKGTVTITLEIPLEKPCDLGTWNWSAKAE